MNNVYGGLVSSPYNKLDTVGHFSVTHTFDGKTIDGGVEEPATIILTTFPESIGAVSGDGIFFKGSSVTVVATPDSESEYPEFDGWYDGETKVSENVSYTFTVNGTRTLVAKFKEATPVQTPAVQIFTDQECTTRPVVGGSYTSLYARFNKPYGFGSSVNLGDSSHSNTTMAILTPDAEYPDDRYQISVYFDFASGEDDSGFVAGQVVECVSSQARTITAPLMVDFYDE